MKIAFWSNVRGKCATSSNIAGISVMHALLHKSSTVIFENHLNISGIYNYLEPVSTVEEVREKNNYFSNIGMEALFKKILTLPDPKGIGKGYALGYLDNCLYYVPNYDVVNREVFNYELNSTASKLMTALESEFNCVIADISGENNLSTKQILEKTDKVVVNLMQDRKIIDNFFERYGSIKDKCIFILSNYEPDVKVRAEYIIGRYKIKRDRIGIVPYNFEFRQALMQGNVIEFIKQNIDCRKKEYNFYFINELKRTCDLIMEGSYEY